MRLYAVSDSSFLLVRAVVVCVLVAGTRLSSATPSSAGEYCAWDDIETNVEASWDSRYVSEGRDHSDGDCLLGVSAEAARRYVSLGVWYGFSPPQKYRELNLYAVVAEEWELVEGYVAYNHVRYLSDNEYDHEIGAGIGCSSLPAGLRFGLDGYHSIEQKGSFFEASVSGEYETIGRLTLQPSASVGFNAGYVSDGHDGLYNFAARLGVRKNVNDQLYVTGYLAHSWAIDRNQDEYEGDESLRDVFYGGIALGLDM